MPFLINTSEIYAVAKKVESEYICNGYKTCIRKEDGMYGVWVIEFMGSREQKQPKPYKQPPIKPLPENETVYAQQFLLENPNFLEID